MVENKSVIFYVTNHKEDSKVVYRFKIKKIESLFPGAGDYPGLSVSVMLDNGKSIGEKDVEDLKEFLGHYGKEESLQRATSIHDVEPNEYDFTNYKFNEEKARIEFTVRYTPETRRRITDRTEGKSIPLSPVEVEKLINNIMIWVSREQSRKG